MTVSRLIMRLIMLAIVVFFSLYGRAQASQSAANFHSAVMVVTISI